MASYKIKENDLLQIKNLELLAKQVVEGFITGLHKSPYHGFSVEFAEHRLYNNGESTRLMDWKLYARTDKLFVKRFEEETNLRCQLVIDTSSSMYYPLEGLNKIRFSVIAAASLIQMMRKQRDASGITLFDDKIWFNSPSRLTITHQRLLFAKLQECLDQPSIKKGSQISGSLHQLAETLHKRSLVIIFSDMLQSGDDSLFAAMQHLRYNNHEVILFDVNDKKLETEFEFNNRPYLFRDSETGEEIKLHPHAVKEQYLASVKEFKNNLKLKCMQFKIDYYDAFVENDFNQILMPFLIKRSKVK
ncbi:MAG: DUF58 domain-containing protein [Bacteroidota bacterium]|nr:DUF58 domain-containing protein [Bacteroidota bacterium]